MHLNAECGPGNDWRDLEVLKVMFLMRKVQMSNGVEAFLSVQPVAR